ncbi:MAG: N-acetyltransferase [Bacillota bacterium]|nr:N-acetyltransferase [Bacillota bacterium]
MSSLGERLSVERLLDTPRGQVLIRGALPPSALVRLTLDPSLRMFRPPDQQKQALLAIAAQPLGAVVAATFEETVIGYATFHPPDSHCRWATPGLPVLELGALEVAAGWRFMRIGRNVLETAFSADVLEEWIVFSTEYCWHWDLEATRLSVWEYRKLLYAILENVGLVMVPTDDPEIAAHPANMLTVRCGARVDPAACQAFLALARGAAPPDFSWK